MDSIEIYLMRVIISKYKAEVCLEWGSGYSTLHFPFMSSSIKKWTSIEHDPIWYSIMNKKLDNIKHKQIEIILKTPNTYPWTDEFNDGSYSDLIEYINYPRSTGQKYDLILVDGRARKYCVYESKQLSNNGLVIIHDAERQGYQDYVSRFQYYYSYKNPRTKREFVILSDNIDISSFIETTDLSLISRGLLYFNFHKPASVIVRMIKNRPSKMKS